MHGHMNVKWVLMFVTVLSVPINRKHQDPTVYTYTNININRHM